MQLRRREKTKGESEGVLLGQSPRVQRVILDCNRRRLFNCDSNAVLLKFCFGAGVGEGAGGVSDLLL